MWLLHCSGGGGEWRKEGNHLELKSERGVDHGNNKFLAARMDLQHAI